MRAVVQNGYGEPGDVLTVREIDPPTINADEVLVRVHAAGVDAGVWHLVTGLPKLVRLMGFGVRTPKNPVRGMDVAGRVEAVGANVTGLRPGDEVYGSSNGSFAEFAVAKPTELALRPTALTPIEAAAVPVSACTALQALRDRARLKPGQRVLVIGAGGGVGTFAVQLAKAMGAEVTGVCSTSKVDLVRSIGADHVIDYTRDEVTDGPGGYDVIVDIAGNRPVSRLRSALTPRGTLVMIGGETDGRLIGGMDRILGAFLVAPFIRQHVRGLFATVRRGDLEHLNGLIEAGTLKPVVERTFPLDEVPEAIAHQRTGRALGKVVVTP
jgi:NADPH:quinone reductase-like Zn-dependent oxidoreductase